MPGDAYLFDAMRQELARVATLGLAGFDVTTSGDAISEAADAIDGIARAFEPYRKTLSRRDRRALDSFDARVVDATQYLRAHPDFDRFDRVTFIAERVQPLAHALAAAQKALAIDAPPRHGGAPGPRMGRASSTATRSIRCSSPRSKRRVRRRRSSRSGAISSSTRGFHRRASDRARAVMRQTSPSRTDARAPRSFRGTRFAAEDETRRRS